MDDDDDVIVVVHLCYMVTTSLTTTWPGSVVGSFVTLRLWRVPVVVFRGRWSSCTGDVGASCRPWWCCVSGVGGNRCGGAAYHMQKDE